MKRSTYEPKPIFRRSIRQAESVQSTRIQIDSYVELFMYLIATLSSVHESSTFEPGLIVLLARDILAYFGNLLESNPAF